jgi:hypothetical protein
VHGRGDPDGPARFTFDKPSDRFGSFADPAVTAVGASWIVSQLAVLDAGALHLAACPATALPNTPTASPSPRQTSATTTDARCPHEPELLAIVSACLARGD